MSQRHHPSALCLRSPPPAPAAPLAAEAGRAVTCGPSTSLRQWPAWTTVGPTRSGSARLLRDPFWLRHTRLAHGPTRSSPPPQSPRSSLLLCARLTGVRLSANRRKPLFRAANRSCRLGHPTIAVGGWEGPAYPASQPACSGAGDGSVGPALASGRARLVAVPRMKRPCQALRHFRALRTASRRTAGSRAGRFASASRCPLMQQSAPAPVSRPPFLFSPLRDRRSMSQAARLPPLGKAAQPHCPACCALGRGEELVPRAPSSLLLERLRSPRRTGQPAMPLASGSPR